ncbi:MAG: MFS transporter [Pseudomonadota bacterium]
MDNSSTINALDGAASKGTFLGLANFRLLGLLLPTCAAVYAGFQGIQQILIPVQVEAIDAAHKIENLALLTTITSVTAVLGLLAGGALSDRTTGRFGRRAPWLVLSALISAVLFIALGMAESLVAIAVAYSILWFTLNFFAAAFTAILPDRIPVAARGAASAVLGLGTPLGIIVGVNYVARVPRLEAYAGLAFFLVITTIALVVFAREQPVAKGVAPAAAPSQGPWYATAWRHTATMFSGFRSRDFTLAFVSRAFMFLGAFTVTGYAFYILQDHIGTANLPSKDPAIAVSVLGTLQVVAWLVSVPVAGWVADKFDCRKIVVGVSSLGMAAAMAIPVFFPTWNGMVAFYVMVGTFFGAYMAVDLALMSLVLPDKSSEGRDMAVLAVATAGPQFLSPAIAGIIINYLGYDQLFYFGVAASVVGGLLVFLIRSVR